MKRIALIITKIKTINAYHRVAMPQQVTSTKEVTVQGPVVQSIVSLTSLLRGQLVKCFTTLLRNTLKFFFGKNEGSFCTALHCKSFTHFFTKKNWHVLDTNIQYFNKMLTTFLVLSNWAQNVIDQVFTQHLNSMRIS